MCINSILQTVELAEASLLGLPSLVAPSVVVVVEVVGKPHSLSSTGEQVCAIEVMLSALLILSRQRLTTAVQPV